MIGLHRGPAKFDRDRCCRLGREPSRLMPQFDPRQPRAPRQELNITLVDMETTAPGRPANEIFVGLLCLRVQARTGRVLRAAHNASWRSYRDANSAAAVAGSQSAPDDPYQGCALAAPVLEILVATDLVVAHNAALDRPVLERFVPVFASLPWACASTDIAWRDTEGLEQASLDYLLARHGMAPSGERIEHACHSLACVLAQPLPRSPNTGFRHLIEASDRVTLECTVQSDSEPAARTLSALGFLRRGSRWVATCPSAHDADRLEQALMKHARSWPGLPSLMIWRTDAISRFTMRSQRRSGI